MGRVLVAVCVLVLFAIPARAESTCDPDGLQNSGSIYRICMPAPADYNGNLVIWAHGFQHAGTPVEIPEDQLCLDGGLCLPDIVNALGFGFATNSYSKTGLAIVAGKNDILDLVNIYAAQKGQPNRIYLVGASEGGIITALALERHPDVFSAGVAACGPIGSFPLQINYFGDARATFEYFFPGLIPGGAFNPPAALTAVWEQYYDTIVKPIVMAPVNRTRLNEWARVARLPFDAGNYLETVATSVKDVLHYSVVNMTDATETLGGFPFGNAGRLYSGSSNDLLLNLFVPRISAAPAALAEMAASYETTGVLQRPLVTLHTLRDQQIPYWHEQLYALKTLASGALLARHINIPVDRFEHCNFTPEEVLTAFGVMLVYDGLIPSVKSLDAGLAGEQLDRFQRRTAELGLR
jgi:pimeloyl-ACP methyl ester carboxylesterase